MDRREQVAREDLVMFINACFACTGQREFLDVTDRQSVAIGFLHQYILGNYRRLYARCLAAGINHFNQGQAVLNLLATGKETSAALRHEEGLLIQTALRRLPAHRAWKLLEALRSRGINNRRSRAVVQQFVDGRRDLAWDCVKYRTRLRTISSHSHANLPREPSHFLFHGARARNYVTPLFEQFRAAHYAKEAVYELPFSIAEGLAARHQIPRREFLERIAPRMTAHERMRLLSSSAEHKARVETDLTRAPLMRLALFVLSLPVQERRDRHAELNALMETAATRTAQRLGMRYGRVSAVLDVSWSSSGSAEKRRRPLALSLAGYFLLRAASRQFTAHWTWLPSSPLLVVPRGQTGLAAPLLSALGDGSELVVVLSDGYENDPPAGAHGVMHAWKTRVCREGGPLVVHLNPVMDALDYAPRTISPHVATVGVRDVEDIPTALGFAEFAAGRAPLSSLEAYLARRVELWTGEEVSHEDVATLEPAGS